MRGASLLSDTCRAARPSCLKCSSVSVSFFLSKKFLVRIFFLFFLQATAGRPGGITMSTTTTGPCVIDGLDISTCDDDFKLNELVRPSPFFLSVSLRLGSGLGYFWRRKGDGCVTCPAPFVLLSCPARPGPAAVAHGPFLFLLVSLGD